MDPVLEPGYILDTLQPVVHGLCFIICFSNRLNLIIFGEIQAPFLTRLQSELTYMFSMYHNDPTVSSEQVQQVCTTTRSAVATHPVSKGSNSEQTLEEIIQTW